MRIWNNYVLLRFDSLGVCKWHYGLLRFERLGVNTDYYEMVTVGLNVDSNLAYTPFMWLRHMTGVKMNITKLMQTRLFKQKLEPE